MQVLPVLAGARAAFDQRDEAWFDGVGERLGVALALPPFAAYLERFSEYEQGDLARALMNQLYVALASAWGYGYVHITGRRVYTCLVARGDGRVVLGVQPSFRRTPFPNPGWRIRRWFDEPARNAATAAAWAREPERDRDAIAFPISAQPDTDAHGRGRALLAAVVADPADDVARGVYADWLLERGDARGELIRLQCELAALPLRDPRRSAIRMRERNLLSAIATGVAGDAARIAESYVIRRGLLDSVTIRASQLAEHGDDLLAQHPIRHARVLLDDARSLAKLGAIRALRRIPHLEISGRLVRAERRSLDLAVLTRAPTFAATERLAFVDVAASDTAWRAFLGSLAAPRLRALGIDADLGRASLELLAHEATLPTLEELHLCCGSRHGAAWIGGIAARPGLRSLALVRSTVEARDMDRVVISVLARAPALTELALVKNWHLGQALPILADALDGRRLDRLELAGDDLTAAAVAALIRAPGFANLGELAIDPFVRSDDELDPIAAALLASPGTTRVIWRSGVRVAAAGLAELLARRDVIYARDDGSLDLIDR